MMNAVNNLEERRAPLKLVKCSKEYWEFVRQLRNDERIQGGFIEQVQISPEQQISYMSLHESNYFVCLSYNEPVGYVGVIEGDIRICTSPKFQQQGIASFMLSEIMKLFPDAHGKVKINNSASRNLFKKLGFEETFIIYTRSSSKNR